MIEDVVRWDMATSITTDATTRQTETTISVTLNVNGTTHSLGVEPRVTLLDALREHLHLTGTKKGCDHGQCGACAVVLNRRRVNACLTLAVMHEGDEILTIEGLGAGRASLHSMQAAFIECDGFQRGYVVYRMLSSGRHAVATR